MPGRLLVDRRQECLGENPPLRERIGFDVVRRNVPITPDHVRRLCDEEFCLSRRRIFLAAFATSGSGWLANGCTCLAAALKLRSFSYSSISSMLLTRSEEPSASRSIVVACRVHRSPRTLACPSAGAPSSWSQVTLSQVFDPFYPRHCSAKGRHYGLIGRSEPRR
jgi:hypothetical protein